MIATSPRTSPHTALRTGLIAAALVLGGAGAALAQVGATGGSGTDAGAKPGTYGVNNGTAVKSGAPQPPGSGASSTAPRPTGTTSGAGGAHTGHGTPGGATR